MGVVLGRGAGQASIARWDKGAVLGRGRGQCWQGGGGNVGQRWLGRLVSRGWMRGQGGLGSCGGKFWGGGGKGRQGK